MVTVFIKVTKKQPLTLDQFDGFFEAMADGPTRSARGPSRAKRWRHRFVLKAVNPNARVEVDPRTPTELLDEIEARHTEVRPPSRSCAACCSQGQSGQPDATRIQVFPGALGLVSKARCASARGCSSLMTRPGETAPASTSEMAQRKSSGWS